ncbi:MAG: right-handed parallel beta-helix repeat-containing protein, partial [Candidatus Hadarchaeales archaeon]
MNRSLCFAPLLASVAILLAGPVHAATWYVLPGGSGDNSGTSWENAAPSIENVIRDNASPGDTILVGNGTYYENINVDKENLTIRSENGAEVTVIITPDISKPVFEVKENNVTIAGLTIRGSDNAGIYCYGDSNNPTENCVIENNIIKNNRFGIWFEGTRSWTIRNNRIENCTDSSIRAQAFNSGGIIENNSIRNCNRGIYLGGTTHDFTVDNNTIENCQLGIYFSNASGNTASDCKISLCNTGINVFLSTVTILNCTVENCGTGISLWSSSNCTLSGNTTENCGAGGLLQYSSNCILSGNFFANSGGNNFWIMGNRLSHFLHSIDNTNTVDAGPILYLTGMENLIINQENRVGWLGLVNCDNVLAENLAVECLLLAGSQNCRIDNTIAENSPSPIYLFSSDNNSLSNLNLTGGSTGITLCNSNGNSISNCRIRGYSEYNIYLDNSHSNVISNNTIRGGEMYGVCLTHS